MSNLIDITSAEIRDILEEVMDPEIPVLSVNDLGIVRDILVKGKVVELSITPTYMGCPAMDMIAATIKMTLFSHGFAEVRVKQVLSPAWTTDWISEKGKQKLLEYGIAPPNSKPQFCNTDFFTANETVQCPHCSSWNTKRISEFGATACKALYQCSDCKEPFDYFKCH